MTDFPAADRYDRMPFRRTGRSGLDLPAISLGLWHNFGDDVPMERQRDILQQVEQVFGDISKSYLALQADDIRGVDALARLQAMDTEHLQRLLARDDADRA